jgi:hypothetical protein
MTRAPRILTVAAALAASIACGSTSSNTVAGPSPAKCELTATNSTPSFSASGGQGAIAVLAARECVWTAAAQVSWVALMPPAEGQGESTLKYNVQTNPSGLPRRGAINVAGQIVEVGQAGATCRFTLDPTRAQLGAELTSVNVTDRLRVDGCDGRRLVVGHPGRAGERAGTRHPSCARERGHGTRRHGADRGCPVRGHAGLRLRVATAATSGLLLRTATRVGTGRCVGRRGQRVADGRQWVRVERRL